MKRTPAALLVLSLAASAERGAFAQTIAELHHPLLERGKALVSADLENYHDQIFTASIFEPSGSFFRPHYAMMPTVSVGVGCNAQLTLGGTYHLPTAFSYPVFETWDPTEERTRLTALTADMTFRPRSNLEVVATYVFGQSAHISSYARTITTHGQATADVRGDIVTVRGTWLPALERQERAFGSDLDGLNHPLLRAGHWKIDWRMTARRGAARFSDTDLARTDYVTQQTTSADLQFRLGAARGITEHVQVSADYYWHPAFPITVVTEVRSDAGQAYPRTSRSSARIEQVYGARLDGRWRPSRVIELLATATREHEATMYTNLPPSRVSSHTTSSLAAGATWLSRAPRTSSTLSADLQGLYHSFVEPMQLRFDAFAYWRGYRETGGYFDTDVRVYQFQATTGLRHWLQVRGYAGLLMSRNFLRRAGFDRRSLRGGGLTVRVKGGMEAYVTLDRERTDCLARYPTFIFDVLGVGSAPYIDFANPCLEGCDTAHLGMRFVF